MQKACLLACSKTQPATQEEDTSFYHERTEIDDSSTVAQANLHAPHPNSAAIWNHQGHGFLQGVFKQLLVLSIHNLLLL